MGQSNESKCIIIFADKIYVRFFSAEYVLTMLAISQNVCKLGLVTYVTVIEQNKRLAEHLFFNRSWKEQELLYIFEDNHWLNIFQLLSKISL